MNPITRVLNALKLLRIVADAKDAQRALESTREEFDATDGAHPCWWRGHYNGARGMEAKLKKQHAQEILELRAHYDAQLAIASSGSR